MDLPELKSALATLGFGGRVRMSGPERLEVDGCLRVSRKGNGWAIAVIERNMIMAEVSFHATVQEACAAFLDSYSTRYHELMRSRDPVAIEAAERKLAASRIGTLRQNGAFPGQTRVLVQGTHLHRARALLGLGALSAKV